MLIVTVVGNIGNDVIMKITKFKIKHTKVRFDIKKERNRTDDNTGTSGNRRRVDNK